MKNHILIIDDEWVNRELYKEFLVPYGYRVTMAKDGAEGLELAFTSEPDLIILDMILPKISGCKIYELIKKDTSTKDIPVLLISAHKSTTEIKEKCAGMNGDVYTKPINHRKIKERIDNLLGKTTKRETVNSDG